MLYKTVKTDKTYIYKGKLVVVKSVNVFNDGDIVVIIKGKDLTTNITLDELQSLEVI